MTRDTTATTCRSTGTANSSSTTWSTGCSASTARRSRRRRSSRPSASASSSRAGSTSATSRRSRSRATSSAARCSATRCSSSAISRASCGASTTPARTAAPCVCREEQRQRQALHVLLPRLDVRLDRAGWSPCPTRPGTGPGFDRDERALQSPPHARRVPRLLVRQLQPGHRAAARLPGRRQGVHRPRRRPGRRRACASSRAPTATPPAPTGSCSIENSIDGYHGLPRAPDLLRLRQEPRRRHRHEQHPRRTRGSSATATP